MSTPSKPSFIRRLNLRAIVFCATLLFLLGWPIYTFMAETFTHGIHDRGSYKEVDLKAMGFFQFDPATSTATSVPAVYRALDGQRVLLTGLVYPTREARSGITEFTLQYSDTSCCVFGSMPQVQEKVYATALHGRELHYAGSVRYEVLGTLHVTLKKDGGEVIEVYHLDAEQMSYNLKLWMMP